jgi:hypothetical protein
LHGSSNSPAGPWRSAFLSSFEKGSKQFEKKYIYLSCNSYQFTIFDFQRWFYASEYAESLKIEGEILCIDSDAMVYNDFSDVLRTGELLANTDFTGPQYTLFRNRKVLADFCSFIDDYFTDPAKLESLKEFYRTKKSPLRNHGGNLCDMHLLGLYALSLGKQYRNLLSEPAVYDDCFNKSEGFRVRKGRDHKLVLRKKKKLFILKGEQLVPVAGLHFQGGDKKFIPEFYTGDHIFSDMPMQLAKRIIRDIRTGIKNITPSRLMGLYRTIRSS